MLALRGLSRTFGSTARNSLVGGVQRSFRVSSALRVPDVPEEDRPWYVIGVSVADHLGDIRGGLTDSEKQAITRGFADRFSAVCPPEVLMKADVYGKMATEQLEARGIRFGGDGGGQNKIASHKMVQEASKEVGAIQTPSGLVIKHIKTGDGPCPTLQSTVVVHYTGKLSSGKVFDSSVQRGEPATFPLDMVIPGWQEGLMLMQIGGVCKMTIPANLAYGTKGAGGVIPPDAALEFEVELLSFSNTSHTSQ